MKRIALYIDTSSLFGGRVFALDNHLSQLKRLMNLLNNNKNLTLLYNDILYLEIGDKLQFPKIQKHFKKEQIEEIKKIFEENKKEYQKAIHDLFLLGIELDINLSNDEIVDGCKKQYDKSSPWSSGKTNEWKDYFVQKTLANYRIRDSLCDELIILCEDKDFVYMKDHNSKIDVRRTKLEKSIEYLEKYISEGAENFKSYLDNEIYSLEDEIAMNIQDELAIEGCDAIEITIDSIEVTNAYEKDNILFEVLASVYAADFSHSTYDHEDGQYWGVEESNFKVRCTFFGSFDGEYINNHFLGKVHIEGVKTTEIIEEYKPK